MKTKQEVINEIEPLGIFWEKHHIECSDGILTIGNGRCKTELYDNLLNKFYNKETFENKTILDIGCNAGGNLIELSKFNPKNLTGIDYSSFYIKQCEYMLNLKNIKNYKVFNYKFCDEYDYKKYENDLGKFDVIFCLGVIYHCKKKTVQDILNYLYNNGKKIIMSSQTFNSSGRPNVDWDVSVESIKKMVYDAGFSSIITLILTQQNDSSNGKTNNFYFEAIH